MLTSEIRALGAAGDAITLAIAMVIESKNEDLARLLVPQLDSVRQTINMCTGRRVVPLETGSTLTIGS